MNKSWVEWNRRGGTPGRRGRCAEGFTLVELLTVIGIIALMLAILMPALNSARRQARALECANNLRQICIAMFAYAGSNRGNFPPNNNVNPTQYWYQPERLGVFMQPNAVGEVRGRIVTCPEDPEAMRSYAMNVWASSSVEKQVLANKSGVLWKPGARGGSQLILVAEKWSSTGSAKLGWTSTATMGLSGDTPGQKFGAGSGIGSWFAGRWGFLNCELPYMRHRPPKGPGTGNQPVGAIQIGYADGHVALKRNTDLADPRTGLSTLDTLWSPIDPQINQ